MFLCFFPPYLTNVCVYAHIDKPCRINILGLIVQVATSRCLGVLCFTHVQEYTCKHTPQTTKKIFQVSFVPACRTCRRHYSKPKYRRSGTWNRGGGKLHILNYVKIPVAHDLWVVCGLVTCIVALCRARKQCSMGQRVICHRLWSTETQWSLWQDTVSTKKPFDTHTHTHSHTH